MVTVDSENRCIYCAQKAEGSGGCVKQECLDARMKTAMKESETVLLAPGSVNREVIRNLFVKN